MRVSNTPRPHQIDAELKLREGGMSWTIWHPTPNISIGYRRMIISTRRDSVHRPTRFFGSKTPRHSTHRATDRPSSPDQTAGPLPVPRHTGHRNGVSPSGAPYQGGRRPRLPQGDWPHG